MLFHFSQYTGLYRPLCLILILILLISLPSSAAANPPVIEITGGMVSDIETGLDIFNINADEAILFNGRWYFAANDENHGSELWSTGPDFASFALLKDINPGTGDSYAHILGISNNLLYFTAGQSVSDLDLWRTDGTLEGTRPITSPELNSQASIQFGASLGFQDALYFFTTSFLLPGAQLWRTDGTDAGTQAVLNFPAYFPGTNLTLVAMGDNFYFPMATGDQGIELWISDGTAAGTHILKDINPGSASSTPNEFIVWDDLLFFSANDGSNGGELWCTDGTEAGTELWEDIRPGPQGAEISNFFATPEMLWFAANDGVAGNELWGTDGETTEMIMDFMPDSESSWPHGFISFKNQIYFIAYLPDPEGFGDNADQIVRMNLQTMDLEAIRTSSTVQTGISPLTPFGNYFAFRAGSDEFGEELWVSDGTLAGTRVVKDITPGFSFTDLMGMFAAGDRLFFNVQNFPGHSVLWQTDGTEAGTLPFPIHSVTEGQLEGGSFPQNLMLLGNRLIFQAHNQQYGMEWWATDGTAAGTTLIKDILPGSVSGANSLFKNTQTHLFFDAYYPDPEALIQGDILWVSDGTSQGTKPLLDPKQNFIVAQESGVTATAFYFGHADGEGETGIELWVSDGTSAGTRMVKDINAEDSSSPSFLTSVGNLMYFAADDGKIGQELWVTDGTTDGTRLVKDITPGPTGTDFSEYNHKVVGTQLFFMVTGPGEQSMWVTDGTSDGTHKVMPWPTHNNDLSDILTGFQGRLYFTTFQDQYGEELWATDGTMVGSLANTFLVKDFIAGNEDAYSKIGAIFVHADRMYLSVDNGENGTELWVSDGTPEGTALLKDIWPGKDSSTPSNFVVWEETVFFSAYTPENGRELWMTDGTTEGTRLAADLLPGVASSQARPALVLNDRLYLSASDGVHNVELWSLVLDTIEPQPQVFYYYTPWVSK